MHARMLLWFKRQSCQAGVVVLGVVCCTVKWGVCLSSHRAAVTVTQNRHGLSIAQPQTAIPVGVAAASFAVAAWNAHTAGPSELLFSSCCQTP